MNRFTVDIEFFEAASKLENINLFTDVLIVFTQDNEYKICIDSSKIALEQYRLIAESSEWIKTWIGLMNATAFKYVDFIEIENGNYEDSKELYIDICSKTFCQKKRLIVKGKQPYERFRPKINRTQIELIDGYEAKEILNKRIVQISYGDNSSNIIGDGNTINPK